MTRFYIILLTFLQAIGQTTTLTCHDYMCSNGNCMTPGKTCVTNAGSCQTQLSGNAKMFYCSEMSGTGCISTAAKSSGTITFMGCCTTELCNNDGMRSPFKEGQKYCYSASCDTEGCLDGLIKYIDTNKLGAHCKADENGCQITKQTYRTRNQTVFQETIGCAPSKCTSTTQTSQDGKLSLNCCTGHLCTEAGEGEMPGEDTCYEYSCSSTSSAPCMSMTDAIKQKKTGYCGKTEKGCFTLSVTSSNMSMINSGCVGKSPGFDQCRPSSVVSSDTRTTTTCCNSRNCNNGTNAQDDKTEPNKKYCHVYTCQSASSSTPCLSLTEAIKQQITTVCEMNDNGCMYTKASSPTGTVVFSDCIGNHSGGPEQCIPLGSWDSDNLIRCCKEDRCNPENTRTSGAPAVHTTGVMFLVAALLSAMIA